jgi:hypothetical protein
LKTFAQALNSLVSHQNAAVLNVPTASESSISIVEVISQVVLGGSPDGESII